MIYDSRNDHGVWVGLRSTSGRLWLVADDLGVDVVLDEWERGDSQLVARDGVYDEWQEVGPSAVLSMRARARQARRERQALQGPMRPEAHPTDG